MLTALVQAAQDHDKRTVCQATAFTAWDQSARGAGLAGGGWAGAGRGAEGCDFESGVRLGGLRDRGVIAQGKRADVVLVSGDTTVDIAATKRSWSRCGLRALSGRASWARSRSQGCDD